MKYNKKNAKLYKYNLKANIKQLNCQKGGLIKEINKLKKANEFLKANRRAPNKEEILAYEKNIKGLLKREKVAKSWINYLEQ